jgi:hypothetical protein
MVIVCGLIGMLSLRLPRPPVSVTRLETVDGPKLTCSGQATQSQRAARNLAMNHPKLQYMMKNKR